MYGSRAGALAYGHYDYARAGALSRRTRSKIGVQQNEIVWIESRRGKVKARVDFHGRNVPPKGLIFVPFFDEKVYINRVTLDHTCPLSKETDYKKCAVKIYKA